MDATTIQTLGVLPLADAEGLHWIFWLTIAIILAVVVVRIDDATSIVPRILNALKQTRMLLFPNHARDELNGDEHSATRGQRLFFFFWYWFWELFVDPVGRIAMFFACSSIPVTYLTIKFGWQNYLALPCGMYLAVYAIMPFAGLMSAIACGLMMGYTLFGFSWYMLFYVPMFCSQCRLMKSVARLLKCRPERGCPWRPFDFAIVTTLAIAVSGVVLVGTELALSFVTHEFCPLPSGELWWRVLVKCVVGTAVAAPAFWFLCWLGTGVHIFRTDIEVE